MNPELLGQNGLEIPGDAPFPIYRGLFFRNLGLNPDTVTPEQIYQLNLPRKALIAALSYIVETTGNPDSTLIEPETRFYTPSQLPSLLDRIKFLSQQTEDIWISTSYIDNTPRANRVSALSSLSIEGGNYDDAKITEIVRLSHTTDVPTISPLLRDNRSIKEFYQRSWPVIQSILHNPNFKRPFFKVIRQDDPDYCLGGIGIRNVRFDFGGVGSSLTLEMWSNHTTRYSAAEKPRARITYITYPEPMLFTDTDDLNNSILLQAFLNSTPTLAKIDKLYNSIGRLNGAIELMICTGDDCRQPHIAFVTDIDTTETIDSAYPLDITDDDITMSVLSRLQKTKIISLEHYAELAWEIRQYDNALSLSSATNLKLSMQVTALIYDLYKKMPWYRTARTVEQLIDSHPLVK